MRVPHWLTPTPPSPQSPQSRCPRWTNRSQLKTQPCSIPIPAPATPKRQPPEHWGRSHGRRWSHGAEVETTFTGPVLTHFLPGGRGSKAPDKGRMGKPTI